MSWTTNFSNHEGEVKTQLEDSNTKIVRHSWGNRIENANKNRRNVQILKKKGEHRITRNLSGQKHSKFLLF